MNSDNSYDLNHYGRPPQDDDSPGSRFRAFINWTAGDLIFGIIAVVFLITIVSSGIALLVVEPYGEDTPEAYFGSAVGTILWQVGFVMTVFLIVRRKGGSWPNLGLRRAWLEARGFLRSVVNSSPLPAIPTIAITGYLTCYLLVFIYNVIVQITGADFLEPGGQLPEDLFDTSAVVVATGLAVVIGAPIAEEILFRGFIFGGLRRYMPLWPAMLISGVIFSLVHFDVGFIIPFSLIGIVLAYVYERSGTLYTSIGMHLLFNLTSFSFLLLFPELRSP